MSISLVKSLLPSLLIDKLTGPGDVEGPMRATSFLIVNIVLKTIEAFKGDHFKLFDANPGDRGCQYRAFELLQLKVKGSPFSEECSSLASAASRTKELLQKRQKEAKEIKNCSSQKFFQEQFSAVEVSKEMEYILHSYLSTVLRTPYKTFASGVVLTRSDVYKLEGLSSKITMKLTDGLPNKILQENQKKLSQLSIRAIREAARDLVSLPIEEKNLIVTMLSEENTHVLTRTFGCSFYGLKTVLYRLREEERVICLKSVVPQGGQSFRVFLKPNNSGEEFVVLEEEALASLPLDTLIVVFEAEISMDKQRVSQLLMKYGFTETLLIQAAEEPLYEEGTEVDKITLPESAKKEVLIYREKRLSLPRFMAVDHVYFNALGGEQ